MAVCSPRAARWRIAGVVSGMVGAIPLISAPLFASVHSNKLFVAALI